jgi:hypothetical protein
MVAVMQNMLLGLNAVKTESIMVLAICVAVVLLLVLG